MSGKWSLIEYEWDYDSGLGRFVYENKETGELADGYRLQKNHWVPPRFRVPLKEASYR